MNKNKIQKGSGCIQWRVGSWFGAQVGATMWILLMGLFHLVKSPILGSAILACFIGANLAGLNLWRRRFTLRPYPAFQSLILITGLFSLVSFIALEYFGASLGVTPDYKILLIFPGMILFVHFLEKHSQRSSENNN